MSPHSKALQNEKSPGLLWGFVLKLIRSLAAVEDQQGCCSESGTKQSSQANGFSVPTKGKCLALRVTTVNPYSRAIAAICVSRKS